MKQEHLWIWISSKYAAGVHLLNEFVVCWICVFVSDPEHWTTLNVFEQFLQILNNPKRFKATMWTRTTYLSISTKHKNVQEFCYFGFRVIENRSTWDWNRRAAIPTKSAVVHMSTESVVGFCCIAWMICQIYYLYDDWIAQKFKWSQARTIQTNCSLAIHRSWGLYLLCCKGSKTLSRGHHDWNVTRGDWSNFNICII